MELEIKYHDTHIRRINLDQSFFDDYENPVSVKALSIASDLGHRPYFIAVYKGKEKVFERTFFNNTPEEKKTAPKKVIIRRKRNYKSTKEVNG